MSKDLQKTVLVLAWLTLIIAGLACAGAKFYISQRDDARNQLIQKREQCLYQVAVGQGKGDPIALASTNYENDWERDAIIGCVTLYPLYK